MMRKHALDLFLLALTLACLALMFISSSDPLLPSLRGTTAGQALAQFKTGNQIVFDLSVGVIASVIMYVLVVRLPERTKRRRLRQNLARNYVSFKKECIAIFLGALQSSYNADLVDELIDRRRFREFFTQGRASGEDRWGGVANGMDDYRVKTLVVELEILMNEIHYVLGAIDVRDPRAFDFFKHMSQVLYRFKNSTAEYDDVKSLLRFMWSLHTGWNFVDGYPEADAVEEMIAMV